ncbi:MAG: hypothetical protein NDI84_05655, partial [Steroidobacteraceae bacterium]|nr:hypothetical protein [Steroidobacteraceae bacterium]
MRRAGDRGHEEGDRGQGTGDRGAGAPWMVPCVMLIVLALGGCAREDGAEAGAEPAAAAETASEHAARHADPLYRCPMHPDVVRNEPGECPICGMALV